MRSARLAGSSPILVAQLHHLVPSADEKARFFMGWWQRMHEEPDPLVADSLKFVEWAEEGAAAQRFVWEVCRWPQGDSSTWMFVCWMIDGDGMWTRSFPSKQVAMAYFAQPSAVVMVHSQSTDGSAIKGVRLRRVS